MSGLFIATVKVSLIGLTVVAEIGMTDKCKPAHVRGVALHRVGGIVDGEIFGMCVTDVVVEIGAGGDFWQERLRNPILGP